MIYTQPGIVESRDTIIVGSSVSNLYENSRDDSFTGAYDPTLWTEFITGTANTSGIDIFKINLNPTPGGAEYRLESNDLYTDCAVSVEYSIDHLSTADISASNFGMEYLTLMIVNGSNSAHVSRYLSKTLGHSIRGVMTSSSVNVGYASKRIDSTSGTLSIIKHANQYVMMHNDDIVFSANWINLTGFSVVLRVKTYEADKDIVTTLYNYKSGVGTKFINSLYLAETHSQRRVSFSAPDVNYEKSDTVSVFNHSGLIGTSVSTVVVSKPRGAPLDVGNKSVTAIDSVLRQ